MKDQADHSDSTPPPDPYRAPEFASEAPPGSDLGESAAIRMLLPVGRSIWAIVAGYLGLFSVLLIPAPLAIICGIVAVVDIRRNPQRHGLGRAIFGIVLGSLGTVVLAFGMYSALTR